MTGVQGCLGGHLLESERVLYREIWRWPLADRRSDGSGTGLVRGTPSLSPGAPTSHGNGCPSCRAVSSHRALCARLSPRRPLSGQRHCHPRHRTATPPAPRRSAPRPDVRTPRGVSATGALSSWGRRSGSLSDCLQGPSRSHAPVRWPGVPHTQPWGPRAAHRLQLMIPLKWNLPET